MAATAASAGLTGLQGQKRKRFCSSVCDVPAWVHVLRCIAFTTVAYCTEYLQQLLELVVTATSQALPFTAPYAVILSLLSALTPTPQLVQLVASAGGFHSGR